jgi:chromosomal replication initiation ATPase DnaA
VLDGRFRFENFIVGTANRLAASAARAVAETPGTIYNPLFIYSSSGLGKTHLLAAIGHHAATLHPTLTVEFVTVDDFVDQLHGAIASGQADAFKRRYHDVGMLLMDDLQFLAGRVETQSEILRVLNALQQRGRQIVMASDRPPGEMADVDERLLTRLTGGLIVDIGPPDYETRVAILRASCAERGARFSGEVLEEIARTPLGSVREMQGALNRVIAHQAMSRGPLSVPEVWQILGTARTPPVSAPNEFEAFLRDIASTVENSVDTWRLQLGDRIAWWSGQGYRTATLEAALDADEAPDVAELDGAFTAVVDRLRALEAEAIRLDIGTAARAVFRDPERLAEAEELVSTALRAIHPPPGPEPNVRLRDLTRCSANQLALQVSAAVIEEPGTRYNPLVLHGPRGAGKTHLAHAIGNALASRNGEAGAVACVSGEAFVQELIAAIQNGSVDRWRYRYRSVDALIIDGIQALDGKERSQEEFFHLFNILHQDGRQIILTSDRPFAGFRSLESRLRTRFEAGLVVHVGAPPIVDRAGRDTPVPEGDEAAAPTIDGRIEEPTGHDAEAGVEAIATSRLALDPFFLDSEKMIVDWPEPDGRLLEELT